MESVFKFLETYETWIYLLLGLIAFPYLNKVVVAWQEWRLAVFGLERETAQRRLSLALTVILMLLMLATMVFSLVSFVAPVVPRVGLLNTPTLDVLSEEELTTLAEAAGQETPQPEEGETDPVAPGCMPDQIEWTAPRDGDVISDIVELRGTVYVPNLGFYKYEYARSGSENWITIAAGNERKRDELLGGVWNTALLEPGDYRLRLVVTDNQNAILPICEISITVREP